MVPATFRTIYDLGKPYSTSKEYVSRHIVIDYYKVLYTILADVLKHMPTLHILFCCN